ncbi:hypothetical protein KAW43_02655 [Candidatus Parcubacteria bacterium]|nr:hypothetical protein [Candidatus Parcubacteria bacterium]
MKKIILGIVITSFLLMPVAMTGLATVSAQAAAFPPTTSPSDSPHTITTTSVMATLGNIANWIFYILIAVSVVLIVLAGMQYATAQGDPEKIKDAGQKVLYALVGIIVAALAKGLVVLVQYFPKT